MAATYAHATALRRLADRYVVEAALAVANAGRSRPRHGRLRRAADGDGRAGDWPPGRPRRHHLAEAVLLEGREGEVFDGVDRRRGSGGPVMQIADPAVLARVGASEVSYPATRSSQAVVAVATLHFAGVSSRRFSPATGPSAVSQPVQAGDELTPSPTSSTYTAPSGPRRPPPPLTGVAATDSR